MQPHCANLLLLLELLLESELLLFLGAVNNTHKHTHSVQNVLGRFCKLLAHSPSSFFFFFFFLLSFFPAMLLTRSGHRATKGHVNTPHSGHLHICPLIYDSALEGNHFSHLSWEPKKAPKGANTLKKKSVFGGGGGGGSSLSQAEKKYFEC